MTSKVSTLNLSCYPHYHLVKKKYFNRSTNHYKDLEFMEKTNVFIIEIFLPPNYSANCKIQYSVYSDLNNSKISGTIKNNSSTKIITIPADTESAEYFVSIKIISPENTILEVCHQFVSKSRADTAFINQQKKSDANCKYKDENCNELEEVIEYTTITRASVDLLELFGANPATASPF